VPANPWKAMSFFPQNGVYSKLESFSSNILTFPGRCKNIREEREVCGPRKSQFSPLSLTLFPKGERVS
jgi:hypothetical protein